MASRKILAPKISWVIGEWITLESFSNISTEIKYGWVKQSMQYLHTHTHTHTYIYIYIYKGIKQSRYRPGVALRVPGS